MNTVPDQDKKTRFMLFIKIVSYLYLGIIIFAFTPFTHNLDTIKTAALFIVGPLLLFLYIVNSACGLMRLLPKYPLIIIIAYILMLFLSTVFAGKTYSWAGWIALMQNLACLGGFFIFFGLLHTKRNLSRAIFSFILMAFATCAFGLFHHLGGFGVLYKILYPGMKNPETSLAVLLQTFIASRGCMMGTFLHSGIFAYFLLMTIPIALFYMVSPNKRGLRIFTSVAILLMFVCLIFALQGEVYPLKFTSSRAIIRKGGWKMFLHGPLDDDWHEKEGSYPLNLRTILIGCGPGSFGIIFPRYRSPDYADYNMSHVTLSAHNRYLDLLCETGILGFACYMGFIFIFFAMGIKRLRESKDKKMRLIICGFLSGVFVICVYDFFKQSAQWESFGASFWIILGIGFGVFEIARENRPTPVAVSTYEKTTLAILCFSAIILSIISGIYGIRYWEGEIHYNNGLSQSKRGESYKDEIRRLDKYNPEDGDDKDKVLKKIEDWEKIAERHYQSAILEFQKSIRRNPTYLSAYYKLGHVYGAVGDHENALKTYLELQKFSPDYAEVHFNLGVVYSTLAENAQDRSAAADNMKKSLKELKIAARLSNNENIQNLYRRKIEESKKYF
ncbi:tetratricopeptide repeat protein [Candidatus Sumerlaeota bacterium]|nr:tetratricopeptide repeat protein [Candidatus Sumerlaeota bacterium]